MITVNEGIADAYLRALPPRTRRSSLRRPQHAPQAQRTDAIDSVNWKERLGVPANAPLLIVQGAYLDKDRGVVQAVNALSEQPSWHLVVVGAGEEWEWARNQRMNSTADWSFCPKCHLMNCAGLTASADVGLSLDQGVHGNYLMSLPNKLV